MELTPGALLQLLFSGLTLGSVYAIVALGFTVIYNATGVVNFAQGEFLMLGGMLMATGVAHGLPLALAAVIAVAAVSVIGVVMEAVMIAPLGRSRVIGTVIMTIAVAIILKGLALLAFGSGARAVPPFSGETPIVVLGAAIFPQGLWVLGTTVALLFAFWLFFQRSVYGWSLLAVSDQPDVASLMGISVRWSVAAAYAVSAGSGAVAGVVIAPISFATWDMGTMLALKGFAACVLGGMGSALGAVLGGVILGLIEAFVGGLLSTGYRDALSFLALLAMLFVRPAGLLARASA